ncbi:hypothetical protein H0H87_002895 [Tephrocybe sp. NHM501043]|nr:hypothetical protein H0H87_002895 [Tephrocybe sp. NHM501043]
MRGEEHAYYARAHKLRPRREEESEEHYRSRVQRHLDEQQAGEERRKREGNELKAKREVERDRERREAEKRQRIKSSAKKALATEQRQKDIDTRRLRQEATQKARSAVFAAARVGDAKRVKQGVWGEYVDASGGEIKDGCQDFVKVPPSDPQETLLHIAARNGDHTLVKWLDGHGAELEERDSNGFTAFHVALKYGHLSVVAYFFDEHVPSADTTKVYELPPATSLLSLALDSLEPELVWMILDRKLASKQDMSSAWERLSAERGKLKETVPTKAERIQDIEQLLGRYGGFTSRSISRKESRDSHSKSRVTHAKADTVPQEKTSAPQQGRQRARRRGRGRGSFKTSMAMR